MAAVVTALVVTTSVLTHIRDDAGRRYPAEAVGLLAAPRDRADHGPGTVTISRAEALPNRAHRPRTGVYVDPAELARCVADLTAAGFVPVGAYHSHPDAGARPSDVDRRAVRVPGVEIIVAVGPLGAGTVKGWWLRPGRAPVEMPLRTAAP